MATKNEDIIKRGDALFGKNKNKGVYQIGLGETSPTRTLNIDLTRRKMQAQANEATPEVLGQPTKRVKPHTLDSFIGSDNPSSKKQALGGKEDIWQSRIATDQAARERGDAAERTVRDKGLDSLFGEGWGGIRGSSGETFHLNKNNTPEQTSAAIETFLNRPDGPRAERQKYEAIRQRITDFHNKQDETNRLLGRDRDTPEGIAFNKKREQAWADVDKERKGFTKDENGNWSDVPTQRPPRSVRLPDFFMADDRINSEGITYSSWGESGRKEQRKAKARELREMDPTLSARRAYEMAGISNLNQRKAMTEQWKVEDENETERLETRQASIEAAATEAAKANKEDKKQTTEFLNNNLDEDTLDLYMAPEDPNNPMAERERDQNMVNMHSQLLTAMATSFPEVTVKNNQRLLGPIVMYLSGLEESLSDQYFEVIKNAYKTKDPANIAVLEEQFGFTFPK